jgi:PKD repeat protein
MATRRATWKPDLRSRRTTLAGVVALALLGSLLGLSSASAATGDVGYQDQSYSGAGDAPTADKPQSKLWFNDGSWWADMFDTVSKRWHIFQLNRAAETWTDTGVRVDDRPNTHGDTLWDGTHLYVGSNVLAGSSSSNVSGQPARLYRYSYDTSTHTYRLDAGFPVSINNVSSESVTIDKDSRGVLWATWTQGQRVYVNATNGTDNAWGTPFVVGVPGATGLDPDDISAVAAFGKTKVGLMWSNQATSTMYFALHKDGDAATTWTGKVAVSDTSVADDHINLKQLEGDDLGHLYAAVKTGYDEIGTSTSPQIMLLALNPSSGNWSATTFGTVADCHTRPQLVIDSTNKVLHMFATAPSSGGCPYSGYPGTIYEKTTSLNDLNFPAGRGTPVIQDGASPNLNNVTTTKQNVTAASGIVLLASNDATRRYWHADLRLTGSSPTVRFSASPTSGTAPLAVTFTDGSTGGVSSWAWTFGDGATSTAQNPTHTYTTPGTYTVTLTGTTSSGTTASSSASIQVNKPSSTAGIAFGGATSTGTASLTGTTVTLTKPSGAVAGDVLVASFTTAGGPRATPPTGWTSFLPTLLASDSALFGFYHVVTAADASTTSWTWTLSSAQKWSGGIARYLNVNTTSPLDSTATVASSADYVTSITVPGVTTSTPGAVVIGGQGGDTSTVTGTPPSGWTDAWQDRTGKLAEAAYSPARAAAGTAPATTWTVSAARTIGAWTVALKPASTAGP